MDQLHASNALAGGGVKWEGILQSPQSPTPVLLTSPFMVSEVPASVRLQFLYYKLLHNTAIFFFTEFQFFPCLSPTRLTWVSHFPIQFYPNKRLVLVVSKKKKEKNHQ